MKHSTTTRPAVIDPTWIKWRRHLVGLISLGLLAAAGAIWWRGAATSDLQFAQGVCVKCGITLFMLWLALPQLEKTRLWTAIPVAMLVVVAVLRPQLLPVLLRALIAIAPLLLAGWLLWKLAGKPRAK